ncbi:hypothetical protein Lal_00016935, partial [Lupinus albus]
AERLAKFHGKKRTYNREFYNNFHFKDGAYVSLVKGKLFTLDEDLFLQVGCLTSDRSPLEIFKVMSGIASSPSRLLAYGIFISHVIDHLGIDMSVVDMVNVNSRQHLVGDNLIHKLDTYKYSAQWMYQEDHSTIVDLELTDKEDDANQVEQHLDQPHVEASNMPREPPFGLAHLETME